MWLDYYLVSYTKINSKWIKDLNARSVTIKLLEGNIGSKLPDISLGNDFLDLTPKAKATEAKINMWDMGLHQTKKPLYSKVNCQQNEKAYWMGGNICKSYIQ